MCKQENPANPPGAGKEKALPGTDKNPNGKSHVESVHLLRGIAALLVVLHHSIGWFPLPLITGVWAIMDPHGELGQLGVAVFFVISGFVLPLSLNQDYSIRYFPRFLAKRFVRIEPTYVCSIIFAAVILYAKTRLAPHGVPWIPSVGQLLSHLLYLIPFTHYSWLNAVYWTLAIEFQYYITIGLLFPIFQHYSRKSEYLMGIGVVLFACLIFLSGWIPQIGLLKQAPFFALGLLAFDLFLHPGRIRLGLAVGICIAGIGFWKQLDPVLLVAALVSVPLIIYWRPGRYSWRWLGTISYSLYVIHYPLVTVINQSAPRIFKGSAAGLLYFIPCLGILCSLAAAWLLYKFVEGPTQKLAKSIRYGSPTSLCKSEMAPATV